ncbi:MAG: hypothetical protein BIFFINMI_02416 [Phycisphaerae bacterium]|nr:hypothetical protein [Phycisphaerae bacterium]
MIRTPSPLRLGFGPAFGLLLLLAGCNPPPTEPEKGAAEFQQSRREAALSAEVATLKAKLDQTQADLDSLRNGATRYDKETLELRNFLYQEKEQNRQARETIGQLVKKLQDADEELKRLRPSNQLALDLGTRVDKLSAENKDLRLTNSELADEVKRLRRENEDLATQVKRLQQELEDSLRQAHAHE